MCSSRERASSGFSSQATSTCESFCPPTPAEDEFPRRAVRRAQREEELVEGLDAVDEERLERGHAHPARDLERAVAPQVQRDLREAEKAAQAVKAQRPIAPEGDDPLWGLPPEDPRLRYARSQMT